MRCSSQVGTVWNSAVESCHRALLLNPIPIAVSLRLLFLQGHGMPQLELQLQEQLEVVRNMWPLADGALLLVEQVR